MTLPSADVVIIGGGAAGLMCALQAGKLGKRVLLLDHNKVGKKILMSGGGRCNFTNLDIQPENYLSENPHFCKSALFRYTQWDFIEMVENHGIPYVEKKLGQLFCENKAKDILNMLLQECEDAQVIVKTECEILSVEKIKEGFLLKTSLGDLCISSLVVATGGLSIPTMGATSFGYELAKQFGHTIIPVRAGLVPFTFSDEYKQLFAQLAGVSLDVEVTSESGKNFKEDMLFTHRGLSGPSILQISSYWSPGQSIQVNLLPNHQCDELMLEHKNKSPNKQLKNILALYLPGRLADALDESVLKQWQGKTLQQISQGHITEISNLLTGWQLKPSGTEGYRTAEVTMGGVNTDEISSKTMESKLCEGLFFIGEALDVTGHLGGYNFQWAWASGFAAAQAV